MNLFLPDDEENAVARRRKRNVDNAQDMCDDALSGSEVGYIWYHQT